MRIDDNFAPRAANDAAPFNVEQLGVLKAQTAAPDSGPADRVAGPVQQWLCACVESNALMAARERTAAIADDFKTA